MLKPAWSYSLWSYSLQITKTRAKRFVVASLVNNFSRYELRDASICCWNECVIVIVSRNIISTR
jgi:hypothetical protein